MSKSIYELHKILGKYCAYETDHVSNIDTCGEIHSYPSREFEGSFDDIYRNVFSIFYLADFFEEKTRVKIFILIYLRLSSCLKILKISKFFLPESGFYQ